MLREEGGGRMGKEAEPNVECRYKVVIYRTTFVKNRFEKLSSGFCMWLYSSSSSSSSSSSLAPPLHPVPILLLFLFYLLHLHILPHFLQLYSSALSCPFE